MNADEARDHIQAVEDFRAAYTAYLEGGPGGGAGLRRAVSAAMPRADAAIAAVHAGLQVADPRGSPIYTGLSNLAFLHERPGFRLFQPPLYETLLDSLDSAAARLGHAVEVAERRADRPTFCDRGHLIARTPEGATPFCPTCGAPGVDRCPNCGEGIRVGDPPVAPQFCASCGAAFPWVNREGRIHELQNLLAREELDEPTALQVREELDALIDPNLSPEEQVQRWGTVKQLAPGLVQSGRTIVEGLVGAWVRQQAGL